MQSIARPKIILPNATGLFHSYSPFRKHWELLISNTHDHLLSDFLKRGAQPIQFGVLGRLFRRIA